MRTSRMDSVTKMGGHAGIAGLVLRSLAVLAITATGVQAAYTISYDDPLIPPGLAPGDSFHLAFVSSVSTDRDSGGGEDNYDISHWNTFVSGVAAASSDSEIQPTLAAISWKAIVSTVSVNARDNTAVSAPVYRLDGELIATGYADLWDGSIASMLDLDEKRVLRGGVRPWSGSLSDGTASSQYTLGNGAEGALTASSLSASTDWISGGGHLRRQPTSSAPMYGLSELITIETPPDVDVDGLPDWYELAFTQPSSPTSLTPAGEPDEDGLTNLQEYQLDTRLVPTDPDTDDDKLLDGASITLNSSDTRYTAWATAGIAYFDQGPDRTFRGESTVGTDPMTPDSDDDGLLDGIESNTGTFVDAADTGTDPLDTDTDADGLRDGVESNTGTYVDKHDTGTNPVAADSDADGVGDWYELFASFTSPFDAGDKPNVPYPLPDPDPEDGGVTNKPVKIYILAGQSNMVGIGDVNSSYPGEPGALATIAKMEHKFPNLVDAANDWLERKDVWYHGVVTAAAKKWLNIGCGSGPGTLGPELGFGHIMGWYHDEPVIVLKASQGNRSLGWDFLPPGSARFTTNGTTYAGYGDSPENWPEGTTPEPISWYAGKQYDDCFLDEADWAPAGAAFDPIDNAADVLANFDTLFPDWAAQGYEIAGFFWFQGHKDGGQNGTGSPTVFATRYEQNLGALIDALRTEFDAPSAPFVVATVGFDGGDWEPGSSAQTIWNAQMSVGDPLQHPEYAGTVASADTTPYWRELDESPGAQGYHYNNNGETYMLIGDAAGRAMIGLLNADDVAPPTPDPMTFAVAPTQLDATSITMTATTANDPMGPVEYMFENTTNGNVRTWSTSTVWKNSGLTVGQPYGYRVKARDANTNETAWSAVAIAVAGADTTSPTPDPMTFASSPSATGPYAITMTATTATDVNGIEYFFDCLTPGGHDSGWQDAPTYVDTGPICSCRRP